MREGCQEGRKARTREGLTNKLDVQGPNEKIEIPGQYRTTRSPPRPDQHVMLAGCGQDLLVLASLRMPKRLTMLGDDEREHQFLVCER